MLCVVFGVYRLRARIYLFISSYLAVQPQQQRVVDAHIHMLAYDVQDQPNIGMAVTNTCAEVITGLDSELTSLSL